MRYLALLALVSLVSISGCGDSASGVGGEAASAGGDGAGGEPTSDGGSSSSSPPGGGESSSGGAGEGGSPPVEPAAYEGFGSDTPGGEGKPVVHITTLAAGGEGSLQEALWEGDRTIVFDVGGTIELDTNVYAQGISFVTIDGSRAPAPGITLDGGGLVIEADSHDIIVNGIRVRNAEDDGMRVYQSYNIVIDHCSSANNGDGNLDVTSDSHDVTVQYTLLGASFSGPMLISYDTRDVTIHHNLFASQQPDGVGERNPFLHAAPATSAVDYLMADIRNNLVWGWGRDAGDSYGYGTGVDYGATANVVANFYQTNGDTADLALNLNHESSGAAVFASGNFSGNGVDVDDAGNLDAAFDAAAVTTDSACEAAAKVLASAGARPLDALDQAIVDGISLAACD